jgi:hypothetical protein
MGCIAWSNTASSSVLSASNLGLAVRFGGRRRLRLLGVLGVLNDPLDDLLNLVGADHFDLGGTLAQDQVEDGDQGVFQKRADAVIQRVVMAG